MSDDDDYYDLYGEDVKQTSPSNNFIALDNIIEDNKVSTEQYLNDTIGDVISELLEEVAQTSPPDPIVHLAELLEKKYRDIYETPPMKSGRRKKTSSTVFRTAATIAHNVVNMKNTAAARSSQSPPPGLETKTKDEDGNKDAVDTKERISKSPVKSDITSKSDERKADGKPNGSSISHNVAVSNSKQSKKPASSTTSGKSSTNVSRTSTSKSSNSSDYTADIESSASQSRFKLIIQVQQNFLISFQSIKHQGEAKKTQEEDSYSCSGIR